MEKIEVKETHDFMNVQSFSELPFIRPATASGAVGGREKPMRLFGIDFEVSEESDSDVTIRASSNNTESSFTNHKEAVDARNSGSSSNHSRKFECHYCFRNFPTSQALGGHQNAHKRERQHAKRAHLQADLPFYGFYDYRHSSPWNSAKIYETQASYSLPSTPLTGSPLGVWRVPLATPTLDANPLVSTPFLRHQASSPQIPLFGGNTDHLTPVRGGTSGTYRRYVCDQQAGVRDHVSLDLRL